MGYEVHITRADDWADSPSAPISLYEWITYVDSDPDLRRIDASEATTAEGVQRYESDGLAIWTAHEDGEERRGPVCLDWCEGRISVIDPDASIVCKLHAIAQQLGARVCGDEGEEYDANAEVVERDDVAPAAEPAPRRWWQKLFFFG